MDKKKSGRPPSPKRTASRTGATRKSSTAATATATPKKTAPKTVTPSAISVRRSGVYHSNEEQCSEITKDHGRCKNTVMPNTSKCSIHQRKRLPHEDAFFDSTFACVGYGIWIGSVDTANDPAALKTAGIKSIVNISGFEPTKHTMDMYKTLGIKYHTLETRNKTTGQRRFLGDEPIGGRLSLQEFYNYMDRGVAMIKQSPKPTTVHCFAGINRSASLVAAYLISQYNVSFDQAHQMLINANRKRSIQVLTNRHFVSAMREYANYLRQKRARMLGTLQHH